MKNQYNPLVYSVGDMVADPITGTYGIILEVIEVLDNPKRNHYHYKIEWQDQRLNNVYKYSNHYDICLIPKNENGNRET